MDVQFDRIFGGDGAIEVHEPVVIDNPIEDIRIRMGLRIDEFANLIRVSYNRAYGLDKGVTRQIEPHILKRLSEFGYDPVKLHRDYLRYKKQLDKGEG